MKNNKIEQRKIDHLGLPINHLEGEERLLNSGVMTRIKVAALICSIAPIPIAFLNALYILKTTEPMVFDVSWTQYKILAFGLYWMGAWLILLLAKALMRRVRVMSLLRVSLASNVCAAAALATADYVVINYGNGVIAEGALGFMIYAFACGGIVGAVCICITAYVFSRRHPSPRKSDSVSRKASALTLVFALCTLPAAFQLCRRGQFMPVDPSTIALLGLVMGLAGLRESFLPDVVKEAPRGTRILLWLGAAASFLAAVCFIGRLRDWGSLMHLRSASILVFFLIPAGLCIWRLRATRSSVVN